MKTLLAALAPQDFAETLVFLTMSVDVLAVICVLLKIGSRGRQIRTRWVVVMATGIMVFLVCYCLEVLFHPISAGWKLTLVGPLVAGLGYLMNKLSGAIWRDSNPEGCPVSYGRKEEGVWPPPPDPAP